MGVYKETFCSGSHTNPMLRQFGWATEEDHYHPAWKRWIQYGKHPRTERSWELFKLEYEESKA